MGYSSLAVSTSLQTVISAITQPSARREVTISIGLDIGCVMDNIEYRICARVATFSPNMHINPEDKVIVAYTPRNKKKKSREL